MMEIEFKMVIRIMVSAFVLYKAYKFLIIEKAGGGWDRLIPEPKKINIKEPAKVVKTKCKESVVGKSHTVYLGEPVALPKKATAVIEMKPLDANKAEAEKENDVDVDENNVYGRQDEALDEEDRFTSFEESTTDGEFSSGRTFEELSNVVNVLKGKETSEEKRFEAADTLHGIGHTAFFEFVSTQVANSETIKKLFDEFPESDGYSPKRRKSKIENFDMNDYV